MHVMWRTNHLVPEHLSLVRLVLLAFQVIRSPGEFATPLAYRDAHHEWRVSYSFQI